MLSKNTATDDALRITVTEEDKPHNLVTATWVHSTAMKEFRNSAADHGLQALATDPTPTREVTPRTLLDGPIMGRQFLAHRASRQVKAPKEPDSPLHRWLSDLKVTASHVARVINKTSINIYNFINKTSFHEHYAAFWKGTRRFKYLLSLHLCEIRITTTGKPNTTEVPTPSYEEFRSMRAFYKEELRRNKTIRMRKKILEKLEKKRREQLNMTDEDRFKLYLYYVNATLVKERKKQDRIRKWKNEFQNKIYNWKNRVDRMNG